MIADVMWFVSLFNDQNMEPFTAGFAFVIILILVVVATLTVLGCVLLLVGKLRKPSCPRCESREHVVHYGQDGRIRVFCCSACMMLFDSRGLRYYPDMRQCDAEGKDTK